MTTDKYILKDHEPVPESDLLLWAKWFEAAERRVAFDEINGVRVSTVFLGLDHNFGHNDAPILFETMVFGGPLDQEQRRYRTWDEAEKGHQEMLVLVRRY
jgi:hypothetical protein